MEALLKELNENIKLLNQQLKRLNQQVFNAREAADYLNIGYDTILRLTRLGQIEYIKNGSNYLYTRDCLDRWLERNKKKVI